MRTRASSSYTETRAVSFGYETYLLHKMCRQLYIFTKILCTKVRAFNVVTFIPFSNFITSEIIIKAFTNFYFETCILFPFKSFHKINLNKFISKNFSTNRMHVIHRQIFFRFAILYELEQELV